MTNSLNTVIARTTEQLLPICRTSHAAQAESWWLIEKLTSRRRVDLIAQQDFSLTQPQLEQLQRWVFERTHHNKPLQYILGSVPFCNLEILVEPPILIPRPETEEWCAWLIDLYQPLKHHPLTILDLCSGSGCIALALAQAFPMAKVIGCDISPKALALANKNKTHNAITNVLFIHSDLYQSLDQETTFDLIVGNPPYIAPDEYSHLSNQVKDWEDKIALVAQNHGFAILEKIISDARIHLKQPSITTAIQLPRIVLEHGRDQETHLKEIAQKAGLEHILEHKDLEGIYRWVSARV